MTAYNIEDMKKELYTIGDYSKAEVEAMTVSEIIFAWSSLPAQFA
jgi:hypothetical protein